jgi:hypothetical protein
LLLNILRHRNLPFLLGEHENKTRTRSRESQGGPAGEDSQSDSVAMDELKERIDWEKECMNRKVEEWQHAWRWWHYTKVYVGFFMWFLLPVTIILSTFYFYPLNASDQPATKPPS